MDTPIGQCHSHPENKTFAPEITQTIVPVAPKNPISHAGSNFQSPSTIDIGLVHALPETGIIAHAPGWTLFSNLYMSNGTLFILTSKPPSDFPEVRMMISPGLWAYNTPENIALREPTKSDMDFITPEAAQIRWGGNVNKGRRNRVWSVEGNTVSVEAQSYL